MKTLHCLALALLLSALTPAFAWDTTEPRGKTREIDFTTTEGTIQALDVSPDGKWVVFDLLAHVYRVPASGGEARSLTQDSGIALNFDPRISPDGRHIAFISDRNGQNSLWVMDADGANPRLIADGGEYWYAQPSWAPDGRSLVAVRYLIHRLSNGEWTVSSRIWRLPVDGSAPKLLVGEGLTYLNNPVISSDGHFLYYETMQQAQSTADYFMISAGHHIRRLDLRSGEDEAVTESDAPRPYGYAAAAEVSPDGKQLAFVRRVPNEGMTYRGRASAHSTGFWLRDLATGRERRLFSPITPDHFETSDGYHLRFSPGYVWTRDGRSIVFPEGGQIRRLDVASGALSTIAFSAHVHRTISEMARPILRVEDGKLPVRSIRHPASSPDGATVAFEALGRIWRMAIPGGTPQPLTPEMPSAFQYSPAWSPDGQTIAFTSWGDAEGGHVWKVAARGGKPTRVTKEPGEYVNVTWTPDGRDLVVVRGVGGMFRGLTIEQNTHFQLARLSASGKGTPQTLATLGQAVRPQFGAGGRLYYTENVAEFDPAGEGPDWNEYQRRRALVSLDAQGRDRKVVAWFPFTQNAVLSADGKHIAFQEAKNILLGELTAGADAPFMDRSQPDSPYQWITRSGGLDARWRGPTQLEFVNGNQYVRHDVATGTTEATTIDMRIPASAAPGRIAITNARLITMNRREVIERGTVVVEDGRITCIAATCDTSGAEKIIDGAGKTIIPGLMDTHAHPTYDGALLRTAHPRLAIYLAYGVTTILDPSADEERVYTSAELIAAGRMSGPRVFTAGPPVISTYDVRPIRSLQDAQDDIDRLAGWGSVTIKQYTQRRRDQRQWITEAARNNGHVGVTSERLNLYYDLGTVMDGQSGWEHPLTEHPIYSDVTKFFARSGANNTPAFQTAGQGLEASEYWQARTDMRNDAKFMRYTPWRETDRFSNHKQRAISEYAIPFWTETVKDLLREGGSVSVGAHSKWDGVGAHREIWTFATAITPMEALESATIVPSRYIGIDKDLGSLEAGKIADLVILNSNPLEDIRNTADIAHVMQGGVLYDDDTLDRQWPNPQKFGPRLWLLDQNL